MATALMFVVLIVSYALMLGLVKFTENIIAVPETGAVGDGGPGGPGDNRNAR